MTELLEKLSSYNIFNYLLPGVLFAVIGSEISSYNFLSKDLAIGIFLYYFYGLIISRIGSVILEPILKKLRIIHFSDYPDYIKAAQKDPKIETLSEQNNSYRVLASLFMCLTILAGFEDIVSYFNLGKETAIYSGTVFLFILFVSAYRKQTKYIKRRVESILEKN